MANSQVDFYISTCVRQKIISEWVSHSNSAELQTPFAYFSILGKVKLRTSFNVGEKHKYWTHGIHDSWARLADHYHDLILGMPWLQKKNATIDMCNSLLSIGDNFAISFEENLCRIANYLTLVLIWSSSAKLTLNLFELVSNLHSPKQWLPAWKNFFAESCLQ